MPVVPINYLAVLVAAIAHMVIGALWYGPLFGKKWMGYMGWKPEEMEMRKKGATAGYVGSFIGALLMAYVLSHFIDYAGATTAVRGAQAGFWAWLGFIVPTAAAASFWEGKSWGFYFLNVSYGLITIAVMGAILAVWV